MKRKIVSGFLMMALIVSTMGSFVSCKDYDEDIYVDLKDRISDQASLYEGLKQQVANLEAAVKALEDAKCNCQQDVLKDYVKKSDLDGYMTTEDGSKLLKIEDFAQYVANNNAAMQLLQDAIDALKSELSLLKVEVGKNSNSITKLTELVNSANATAIEAKAKAEEALALAQANAEAIKKLQEDVAANKLSINSLTNVVNTLQKSVNNVQNTIQELGNIVQTLSNTVAGWDQKLNDLLNRTEGIVAQVESNTARIEELEKLYQELLDANQALADYEKVQELINQLRWELEQMNKKWGEDLEKAKQEALAAAAEAKRIAEEALTKAGIAISTADKALTTADNAEALALSALKTAQAAQSAADQAKADAEAAAKAAQDALAQVQTLVAQAEAAKEAAEAAQKAAEDAAALAKQYAEEAAAAGGGLTQEWKDKIEKALADAAAAQATADAAKTAAQAAQAAADAAQAKADAAQAAADAAQKKADQLENDVNELKEAVKNFVTESKLAEELAEYATNADLQAKYDELKALIDAIETGGIEGWDKEKLDQLYADVEALKQIDPNGVTMQDVKDALKDYYTKDEVNEMLKDYMTAEQIQNNYFTKDEINDKIKELNDKITPLEEKVKQIEQDLNDLKAALDKLKIISISVQGTANPTIGYFNLPIDVKSNMLVVYYGHTNRFVFPSSSTFDDDELAAMGVSSASEIPGRVSHGGGAFISGDKDKNYEGNAGTVYMTINPTDALLDDVEFSLVNTQNVESGVKLSKPVASTKVLKFGYGYTRANELGFYESKATLTPENIEGNILSVDPDALLAQAQAALQDKSLEGVLSVGLSFFEAFNNKVDCQAVKAKWADGVKTSDFNIAACAVEPLAIDMLSAVDIPDVPGLQYLQDLVAEIINQIQIDVPEIDFDITKYTDRIQFVDVEILDGNRIVATVKVTIGNTREVVKVIVTLPEGSHNNMTLTELIDAIMADSSNVEVTTENGSHVDANLNEVLTQLFNDLWKINHFDDEMRVSIEDAKQNMIAGIQPYIVDLYNRLNGYTIKVKNMLDLIVVARQENGSVALLSKSLALPTRASGKIDLIPTSYTLELFAPAYKKVVAVTNVFNADGTPADKSLAVQANSGENMAKVIDGKVYATLEGQSGYIYEITLAAVDYHAKENKQKFYVQF